MANHTHARDFFRADGLDLFLNFYSMPCMPIEYAGSPAAEGLHRLIKTLGDTSPKEVLGPLMKHVRQRLDDARDFWEHFQTNWKTDPMLHPTRTLRDFTLDLYSQS